MHGSLHLIHTKLPLNNSNNNKIQFYFRCFNAFCFEDWTRTRKLRNFPKPLSNSQMYCTAENKRGLYRKKLKKYIFSTTSIAYQASKPITRCKCFELGMFFIQAPRNSSQTSEHQSGKMVNILKFKMKTFRH